MDKKELVEKIALNTLVFETLGQPEKEREFTIQDLRRWGFDLILGKKNGVRTFFASQAGREVGDKWEEGGATYEIEEILLELPENKKLFAHIETSEGVAYIVAELREGKENLEILRTPAPTLLMAFFKKHRLHELANNLKSMGVITEFYKQRGRESLPLPYKKLPLVARDFLERAKKVEKMAGFGRVALAYFGKTREKDNRFRVSWLLPTIALFDIDISEKANTALEEFK